MTALLEPHRSTTLASGLTVITATMPLHRSVTLGLTVRCGSRYETTANNGISHLLEHALYRGCEGYPTTYALNAAFERCTSGLDGSTGSESMEFMTSCLAADMPEVIELLGRFVTTPTFADFEVERDVVIEELQDDLDAHGRDVNVENLSRRALFGDTGLGLPVGGDPNNVRHMGVDDCLEWLGHHFVGGNMVLVAVGPVHHDAVLDAVASSFQALPQGTRREVPQSALQLTEWPSLSYLKHGTRQSDLTLTWALPDARHSDWEALFMAYRVLDGGSAARLPHRVIDQAGLAYDLGASLVVHDQLTLLSIDAAVSHAKCAPLLDLVFEVVNSLRHEPPSPDELARQRRRASLMLARAMESPEAWAGWLMQDWLRPDLPPAADRLEKLLSIDSGHVVAAAGEHLRVDRVHAAVVGDLPPLARAGVRRRLHRLRPRG